MIQRILLTGLLVSFLAFVACEKQTSPLAPEDSNRQTVDLSTMDVEEVSKEAESVIGYTLNTTSQTMDKNEERLTVESNTSMAKPTVWSYSWDGEYHIWENTVDQGDFYGEFLRKIQYKTSKDGEVVKKAGAAEYMYAYSSAEGTYGFTEDDPDYGVEFSHEFEGEWEGFKTMEYVITAEGNYNKTNYLVYNGEDAVLEINVDVMIDELTMNRAQPNTLSVSGEIVLEMAPWTATVESDGGQTAMVTIMKNGVVVNSYEVDLRTLLQNVNSNF